MGGTDLPRGVTVTRLLMPGAPLAPGVLEVPAATAHHARVARVGVGEPVEVLDLAGTVAIGRLVAWEGRSCRLAIERLEHGRGEPPEPVVLGLGVLAGGAFDWAVEKATELGATAIVPLLTARVQGRRHDARVERWRRIAIAAVAQCGRTRAPVVTAPSPIAEFCAGKDGARLLALFGAALPQPPLATGGSGLRVLVGPEGGLTEAEIASAVTAGFGGLPLGPRTLRAETAAVAALAAAQQLAGWL